jgi:hypothetical protein
MIAYNTIVNNYTYGSYGFGIDIGETNGAGVVHQNTIIKNNIISVLNIPLNSVSMVGLTFSNNLWSKNPAYLGSGDIVGNPLLSNPAHSVDATIDPTWYTLTSTSPAIGKALILPDVPTDFFGTARGSSPDIGAYEFPTFTNGFKFYLPMILSRY